MSQGTVDRTDLGPVVMLMLNRPLRRNALSRALIAQLSDLLSGIEVDPAIRSVVISGMGPVFSSGMDLKESAEGSETAVADMQALSDLINQVHTLRKPTIAAINGDAYGGGAGLAVACDFAIAAKGIKIGYPEVRRGLVSAVVMHDLVRQVGERRARSLLLTGEPIDADLAERWGLVNRVVDPDQCRHEAVALGRSLSASGPLAVATTKRLIDETSQRPADLRGAAAISAAVRGSDEAIEGMRAFLEKRSPRWLE